MPNISIANTKDSQDLSQLLSLLMAQEADFIPDAKAQEKGLLLVINSPEMGIILKLELEGKIVGMINILFTISTALGAKVGILEDFIIAPEFRKKGYGQLLFKEAVVQAKTKGCQRITLLTDQNNLAAHHFYKSQGMEASAMMPFRKMLL